MDEPIQLPIDGVLDLHSFDPREIKDLVLDYLAARFETDKQYTEKEVNTILQQWHLWNDPAFLRRELVDARRLSRTKNGARYWRDLSNLKR